MLSLLYKCLLGAAVVFIIAILSKSRSYYIAGLVPLFPTFALIAHVIVSQEQGAEALRKTALFGIWSLIPYLIYLVTVYAFATKMSMMSCLSAATVFWIFSAGCLIYGWQYFNQ